MLNTAEFQNIDGQDKKKLLTFLFIAMGGTIAYANIIYKNNESAKWAVSSFVASIVTIGVTAIYKNEIRKKTKAFKNLARVLFYMSAPFTALLLVSCSYQEEYKNQQYSNKTWANETLTPWAQSLADEGCNNVVGSLDVSIFLISVSIAAANNAIIPLCCMVCLVGRDVDGKGADAHLLDSGDLEQATATIEAGHSDDETGLLNPAGAAMWEERVGEEGSINGASVQEGSGRTRCAIQ